MHKQVQDAIIIAKAMTNRMIEVLLCVCRYVKLNIDFSINGLLSKFRSQNFRVNISFLQFDHMLYE
jgi:hypothetical protein